MFTSRRNKLHIKALCAMSGFATSRPNEFQSEKVSRSVIMKKAEQKDSRAPIVDKRFAKANVDPKFKRFPKNNAKIKIDQRFQKMFTDSRFKSQGMPTLGLLIVSLFNENY